MAGVLGAGDGGVCVTALSMFVASVAGVATPSFGGDGSGCRCLPRLLRFVHLYSIIYPRCFVPRC